MNIKPNLTNDARFLIQFNAKRDLYRVLYCGNNIKWNSPYGHILRDDFKSKEEAQRYIKEIEKTSWETF
jgi:hypothetical protein